MITPLWERSEKRDEKNVEFLLMLAGLRGDHVQTARQWLERCELDYGCFFSHLKTLQDDDLPVAGDLCASVMDYICMMAEADGLRQFLVPNGPHTTLHTLTSQQITQVIKLAYHHPQTYGKTAQFLMDYFNLTVHDDEWIWADPYEGDDLDDDTEDDIE